MKKDNIENEIKSLEKEIEKLISLKKEKEIENSKQSKRKWLFFKKSNNLENEIKSLEKEIKKLHFEIVSLKAKDPKSNANLRTNVKNELKAYIIQKILNKPESVVIFKQINEIIDEILKEIKFTGEIFDGEQVKDTIKNEMMGKLKENFKFSQDKNVNTLEAFKK